MASREELSSKKASELQQILEARGLDSTGKKSELVERLLKAAQADEVSVGNGSDAKPVPTSAVRSAPVADDAQMLLAQMRILKEREVLEEQDIEIRSKMEQEQLRVKARKEQLDLEERLVKLGSSITDADLQSVRVETVRSDRVPEASRVTDALATHIQRSLLPPTDLTPFSGDIKEYRLFVKMFDARVANKTTDQSELLSYLEQFTRKRPNQVVRNCLHLGEQGYQQARLALEREYGNPHVLIDSYVGKLKSWPRISPGDVQGLDQLVLFLTGVQNAMMNVSMGELEHPRTLRDVVQKLPVNLRDRWLREADRLMEREREGSNFGFVGFKDLVRFLEKELRVLKNPIFGAGRTGGDLEGSKPRSADACVTRSSTHRVSAVTVGGESGPDSRPGQNSRPGSGKPGPRGDCGRSGGNRAEAGRAQSRSEVCLYCEREHSTGSCDQLRWKPHEERKAFVFRKRLCFGCLQPGHVAKFCRARLVCEVCGAQHATLLHRTPKPRDPSSADASPASSNVVSAGVGLKRDRGDYTMMPVVPVRLKGRSGRVVQTNAFLDQGSSGCFITSHLVNQLGLEKDMVTITIDTVASEAQEVRSAVVEGARVGPVDSDESFALPPLFTLDRIPVTAQDKCRAEDLKRWPHLAGIPLRELDEPVELMIGSNAANLLVALEVRCPEGKGQSDVTPTPVGVKTCLGWYVIGPSVLEAGADPRCLVNFLRINQTRDRPDRSMVEMFHDLYEQDFMDSCEESEEFSVNDREWLTEVKATVCKDSEGHYQVALPKVQLEDIPDSLPTAKRRLESLRNRFRKDPQYYESYKTVMHSLSRDGYAVRVHADEVDRQHVWYIPHHGVQEHEKGKLRVVFDCAARSNGVSLNDMLKGGPNLRNSLVGVLCRFREGPIAFTCDVEAMYHRVHVPESDSELLRFLWFRDDDLDGEAEVWKMRSHVFGAVSSSSVASLALGCCAEEGAERYPEAAKILMRNSYVDDVATATTSVKGAVKLAHDLKALCVGGAFNMRKFTSNSAEFLKEIPVEDRGKNVKCLDLERDRLSSERTLGLKWEVESDSFCFEFKDKRKPVTRRGILSTVSSVFDPLGIIAPVTLRGKALLQRLCMSSCGWDDVIPVPLSEEWEDWLEQAERLDFVRLRRDISGPPGDVVSTELHIFADASETAHAAVAYVRREVKNVTGETEVSVNFLFGKSRLNPIRIIQTIPRLELTSAALAAKVKLMLVPELDMSFESVSFWTDSMIVLNSIRNRTTRFKTFVANRLSFIRSASDVSDWNYVPSQLNPADVGSRGADPEGVKLWLQGPEFLAQSKEAWPDEPSVGDAMPETEVKASPVCLAGVTGAEVSPCDTLMTHYSSFHRLKKAVAWYHRLFEVVKSGDFKRFCVARRRGLRPRGTEWRTELEVPDLERAERVILRHVQTDLSDFPGQLADGPVEVKKGSQLAELRPLMKDGLMVVGGRLGASPSIPEAAKHPVIIPRGHHVGRLLMREAHITVGHQGRDHTLWRLRERFWVIGASADVRKLVKSCVVCRKVNARPQTQMMADLPKSRITSGGPAFEKVGLDVFGPIVVKSGRKEKNRYGLMCTCMVTRAVHVEMLDSLRTDSLINAVRRIGARRGSDQRSGV